MDLTSREMIFDLNQRRFRPLAPDGVRVCSSADLGWKSCPLEQVQTPPLESMDGQWLKNVVS